MPITKASMSMPNGTATDSFLILTPDRPRHPTLPLSDVTVPAWGNVWLLAEPAHGGPRVSNNQDMPLMSGIVRVEARIEGIVQGVGFRPYAHALARRLGLAGRVGNDGAG